MQDVALRLILFAVRMLSSLITALGIRWLLGVGTPTNDMALLRHFWEAVRNVFILPDYLAGVNMSYLTAMRYRVRLGVYDADIGATEPKVSEVADEEPKTEEGL